MSRSKKGPQDDPAREAQSPKRGKPAGIKSSPKVRLGIYVPADLFDRLRLEVARQPRGTSMSDLVVGALETSLGPANQIPNWKTQG
jgi:hypothetical protein